MYFSELFASLEEKSGSGTKASEIGVLSYGVSMTDLEEVFLKLEGDGEDEDDASYQQPASENIMDGDQVTLTNNMHVDGVIQSGQHMGAIDLSELGKATVENSQLVKNRIYALVRMRIRMIYRLKLRIFLQVILPIIFTCVGAAILTTQPTYAPSAPIELDISNLKNDYLATNESNVKIKLDYVGGEEDMHSTPQKYEINSCIHMGIQHIPRMVLIVSRIMSDLSWKSQENLLKFSHNVGELISYRWKQIDKQTNRLKNNQPHCRNRCYFIFKQFSI